MSAFLDPDLRSPVLSPEQRRRRDRRTPRIAVRQYSQSSIHYLYGFGNDQALLNCCACDHKVFQDLLAVFKPVFDIHTFDDKTGRIKKMALTKNGKPKGRKREIDAIGCLGLVLFWYRTRGSYARAIVIVFGLTVTPMYKWLRFSQRVLLSVLNDNPLAAVTPPSIAEVEEYTAAIARKYPILCEGNSVWAAADGLKIPLQKSSYWTIQNQYYNSWARSLGILF